MAVPKTVAPRGRLLERGEAESVLVAAQPFLARIARRVALRARLAREIEVLQLVSDASPRPGIELDELVDKTMKYHQLGGQIDALVERLAHMGARVRDRDACWVDFDCLRPDGVAVYCWRNGEPQITFWHFLHESHSERRPLETAAP